GHAGNARQRLLPRGRCRARRRRWRSARSSGHRCSDAPPRPHSEAMTTVALKQMSAVEVAVGDGERILDDDNREIRLLLARKELTITYAHYAAEELVARPHVHDGHTDSFYVLEGELTFEIGRERKTITVSAGAFVAVPPSVAHSFRTSGDKPARWLTIHAPDGGFSAFMLGVRDGVSVEWDIGAVRADGGRTAGDVIVHRGRDGIAHLLAWRR